MLNRLEDAALTIDAYGFRRAFVEHPIAAPITGAIRVLWALAVEIPSDIVYRVRRVRRGERWDGLPRAK